MTEHMNTGENIATTIASDETNSRTTSDFDEGLLAP